MASEDAAVDEVCAGYGLSPAGRAWLERYLRQRCKAVDRGVAGARQSLDAWEAGALVEWWGRTNGEPPPLPSRWTRRERGGWIGDDAAREYAAAVMPGQVDLPEARAIIGALLHDAARRHGEAVLPSTVTRVCTPSGDDVGAHPGAVWNNGPPGVDKDAAGEALSLYESAARAYLEGRGVDGPLDAEQQALALLHVAARQLGQRGIVEDRRRRGLVYRDAMERACQRYNRGHEWDGGRCTRCRRPRSDAADEHCARRRNSQRRTHGGEHVTRDRIWYAAHLVTGLGASTLRGYRDAHDSE